MQVKTDVELANHSVECVVKMTNSGLKRINTVITKASKD